MLYKRKSYTVEAHEADGTEVINGEIVPEGCYIVTEEDVPYVVVKEEFEAQFEPATFDFRGVMDGLYKSQMFRRPNWGEGAYIKLITTDDGYNPQACFIAIRENGNFFPWRADPADLVATDWYQLTGSDFRAVLFAE